MIMQLPGPRALVRRLLWATAALHAASMASNVAYHGFGLGRGDRLASWLTGFFNVDDRQNLPSWFASGVLLAAACVLWETGTAAAGAGETRYVRHWRVLGVALALLSLDNMADAHQVLRSSHLVVLGAASSWLVVLAPVVLVFAAAYVGFLRHLPARTRRLVIAAGCLYAAGVAATEVFGALTGLHAPVGLHGQALAGIPFLQHLAGASVEELLQLLGSITFLYAVTDRLAQYRRPAAAAPAQARSEQDVTAAERRRPAAA
ncbi:hypothetical protein Cs7R123_49350 [Catellatospora sp. TT07R-123]|uniref:hypothetical protein n=1 Tax=Catellatospora sp. TT07R-123 TaxID=2733863 RepID=UPI001B1DC71A|nr:hypothetical protein [Catellatospora sp. TT07R-123]GHJ47593.1 hypothetical protein Cs7R123_49350 [Catellatospora sp. TT07R-123]